LKNSGGLAMIRVLFLILVVMSSIAFAQTEENPVAKKVEEFGVSPDGYVKVIMDSFYVELGNNPTAQGIIFNYGTDNEIALREKQIQKSIAFRKYDGARITIVRAGFWKELKTEFWVVPAGAENPQPKSSAEKIDEFEKATIGDIKARIDNLFIELSNKPGSQCFILNYGLKNTLLARETQIKKVIAFRKLDLSKVTFKSAGSSKIVKTELWIIPPEEKSAETDKK
jgi:hypothetical protein